MDVGASKSDGYQVFCDHYSSLVKGIKANLDKVGPKLEKAELLTPEAQDAWKNGSHNQNKKTFAILNAIEEKLKDDLDYFWRLVSVLRSLPGLAHLASKLESSSWQSSKGPRTVPVRGPRSVPVRGTRTVPVWKNNAQKKVSRQTCSSPQHSKVTHNTKSEKLCSQIFQYSQETNCKKQQ